MTGETLQELIVNPERLNKETLYKLRNLLARYPYFQTARLLYLKNLYLLHDFAFGDELRKAALYITDRKVLFHLIEGDRYTLTPKQEKIVQELLADGGNVDRTLSLIDAFLSGIPQGNESSLLNLDVSADYTSYLMKQDDEQCEGIHDVPRMKGQNLIDNFIDQTADINPLRPATDSSDDEVEIELPEFPWESNEEDESYFTETLARIYVKQQRYSKALEIIKKLSLKYPKKNAYFADQISFLEKLIINTKSK